jgi:hypothetical protein
MDNPLGAPSYPSVIKDNVTAVGTFPEIGYFYTEYFLVNIEPTDESYKGVTFETDWALSALKHTAYNPADPKWETAEHVLLHIGNIKYLLA